MEGQQGLKVSHSLALSLIDIVMPIKVVSKPKATPEHPTKSHKVVISVNGVPKTIRFGQQGITGDKTDTPRRRAFYARHAKNIAKGMESAAYWSAKVKW
jgi:hypothetical protein